MDNINENNDNDEVLITINYQGTDILCKVDLQTANILLNDPEQAEKYIEQTMQTKDDESDKPSTSAQENTCTYMIGPSIWSSKCKNNNDVDHDATLLLLKLRSEFASKFNDKKTIKQSLWLGIANKMKENGFNIEGGKEGAEKCRQKFANLQRTYLNHITHMRRTGEKTKPPPPYFDEMHDILGSKDKANPPYLEDSFQRALTSKGTSSSDSDDTANETKMEEPNKKKARIVNRFSISCRSLRPQSNVGRLLEHLKEEKEERLQHLRGIENALNVQNQQREKLLQIFADSVSTKKREKESDE